MQDGGYFFEFISFIHAISKDTIIPITAITMLSISKSLIGMTLLSHYCKPPCKDEGTIALKAEGQPPTVYGNSHAYIVAPEFVFIYRESFNIRLSMFDFVDVDVFAFPAE